MNYRKDETFLWHKEYSEIGDITSSNIYFFYRSKMSRKVKKEIKKLHTYSEKEKYWMVRSFRIMNSLNNKHDYVKYKPTDQWHHVINYCIYIQLCTSYNTDYLTTYFHKEIFSEKNS